MSVFGRNQISDKDLSKTVQQRLARTGTASQSKINAVVQHGTVTLTGSLQYAIQRTPILRAVENIPGVHRVVDQLQIVDRKKARHDADAGRYYAASQQTPTDTESSDAEETPTAPAAPAAVELPPGTPAIAE